MRKKRNSRDIADSLISCGQVTEYGRNHLVIQAFNHIYRIDEPYSSEPIITQLDVSKS